MSAQRCMSKLRRARHGVDEPRTLLEQPRLQCRIVQAEPARARRRRGLRVDGDDLEVGVGEGVGGDLRQPVVRAHERVAPARAGRDAEGGLAPGHALLQAGGGHDEVVEVGVHAAASVPGFGARRCRRCTGRHRRRPRCPARRAAPARARRGPMAVPWAAT
jgi:hypothetical protein